MEASAFSVKVSLGLSDFASMVRKKKIENHYLRINLFYKDQNTFFAKELSEFKQEQLL
jgi:hypothetical protein